MNIQQREIYGIAIALFDWLGQQVSGLVIPNELKRKTPAVCFGLTMDHHAAITTLVGLQNPLFSSALALVRPLFESYVRGLWLARCANDTALNAYHNGSVPSLSKLLSELEASTIDGDATQLRRLWNQSSRKLHGFTHAGAEHFRGWDNNFKLTPSYTWSDSIVLLDFSARIGISAAIGLANIVDSKYLHERIILGSEDMLNRIKQARDDQFSEC
jgi:hypothetical protein